jgi:hypothetical protein
METPIDINAFYRITTVKTAMKFYSVPSHLGWKHRSPGRALSCLGP